MPFNRGNGRFGQVQPAWSHRSFALEPGLFGDGFEVCAGAKSAIAGARHNDRANIVIGVGLVERGNHLVHHPLGKGVHLAGAIERQREDAVGDVGSPTEGGGELEL